MRDRSAVLKIDLDAVVANYQLLKCCINPDCEIGPAIKADAYGLGAIDIAKTLYSAGAKSFFVAHLSEGIEVRKILPEANIYVLHGFDAKYRKDYQDLKLIPILNSAEEIHEYKEDGGPCALHFDTGMNRLGIPADEWDTDVSGLNVRMVMSHFASSDEKDSLFNQEQARKFAQIAKRFPQIQKSLANSSGIFRSKDYHYNLVRPGIALYGGNPTPEQKNPMRPVVELHAPILQVHTVKKGETAGYNQTCVFSSDAKVAVVSFGYADGFLRRLSNRGALYWKGYRLPICGRVSMDLTICDLSAVPENLLPARGDLLEVLGKSQDIDALAKDACTNSYEVLTIILRR